MSSLCTIQQKDRERNRDREKEQQQKEKSGKGMARERDRQRDGKSTRESGRGRKKKKRQSARARSPKTRLHWDCFMCSRVTPRAPRICRFSVKEDGGGSGCGEGGERRVLCCKAPRLQILRIDVCTWFGCIRRSRRGLCIPCFPTRVPREACPSAEEKFRRKRVRALRRHDQRAGRLLAVLQGFQVWTNAPDSKEVLAFGDPYETVALRNGDQRALVCDLHQWNVDVSDAQGCVHIFARANAGPPASLTNEERPPLWWIMRLVDGATRGQRLVANQTDCCPRPSCCH